MSSSGAAASSSESKVLLAEWPPPDSLPIYWSRLSPEIHTQRFGKRSIPSLGILYRDFYSAVIHVCSNDAHTAATTRSQRAAIHANLKSIMNRSMEQCGKRAILYQQHTPKATKRRQKRRIPSEHTHTIDFARSDYACTLEVDPRRFYWGIDHGTTTRAQDAHMRQVRSVALLQFAASENSQTHIREELKLPLAYTMDDLSRRLHQTEHYEFLVRYLVGIALCDLSVCHMIPVLAGIMRHRGINQYALFHPPACLVQNREHYNHARDVWRQIGEARRYQHLSTYLSKFRMELHETLFPILHFAFKWPHGLCESLMVNDDREMLVIAEPLIRTLASDDDGLIFQHYGHLQLCSGLVAPQDRLEYARRDVFIAHLIQHSWLGLRKCFLDLVLVDFMGCTQQARCDRLLNEIKPKKQKTRKAKTGKRAPPPPPPPPPPPSPPQPLVPWDLSSWINVAREITRQLYQLDVRKQRIVATPSTAGLRAWYHVLEVDLFERWRLSHVSHAHCASDESRGPRSTEQKTT